MNKKISNILLIITIIFLIIYLILKQTNQIGIYKVMTGSMEPNIHVGDYLLVKKCKEYKEGDIVTFKKDGYYITHRIIKINENTIITKGDANNVADEEIDKITIVGKYIFKNKILNYTMEYKYIVISSIAVLFIISEVFKSKEVK